MLDSKDLKKSIAKAKADLRSAQSWAQNLIDDVKTVFAEHKTEMLVAAGVGFVVGAILF